MKLTFYTKPLCPLCERLEDLIDEPIDQLIAAGKATYSKRDINDDANWYDQYWDRIPVLICESDGDGDREIEARSILEGNPAEAEVIRVMQNLK